MTLTYSNPRLSAVFEDWPHGAHRTRATFTVESKDGKGQRAVRVTIDPKTGRESAPKTLTYGRQARIVDGDNNRTYLAMLTEFGHISIMRADMKFSEEAIFEKDPRYAAVRAFFNP